MLFCSHFQAFKLINDISLRQKCMLQQQSLPTDIALEYYSRNQIPPPLHRVPPEKPPPPPIEPKQVIKRLPISPYDEAALQPKPPVRPVDNFCFDYDAFQEVLDFLNAPPTVDFMNGAYPRPDVAVAPKTDPFFPYPDVVARPSGRKKFTAPRLSETTKSRSSDEQLANEETKDVKEQSRRLSDQNSVQSPSSDERTHRNDSIIDAVRSELLRASPEYLSDASPKDSEVPETGTPPHGRTHPSEEGSSVEDIHDIATASPSRCRSVVPNRSSLVRHDNVDDDSFPLTIFKTIKSRSVPQRQYSDSSRSSRCANTASPIQPALPSVSNRSNTDQPIASANSSYESRDRGRGRDVFRENRHHRGGGGGGGGGSDRDLQANFSEPDTFGRRLSNADGAPEDVIGKRSQIIPVLCGGTRLTIVFGIGRRQPQRHRRDGGALGRRIDVPSQSNPGSAVAAQRYERLGRWHQRHQWRPTGR